MAAPTRGPARPHVGRSAELGRLLTAVTAPDGPGAILAGPAGVGKSHLLDLAVDQLTGLGWSPLNVQGPMARNVPDAALFLSAMASDDAADAPEAAELRQAATQALVELRARLLAD